MKVAVACDKNGKISSHFGHSEKFLIYSVDDGRFELIEERENPKVRQGGHFHESILPVLKDVDVVIAGGMGMGAFAHLRAEDKEVVVTSIEQPEEAIEKLARGELKHEQDRVHHSHSHRSHHHHEH